MYLSGLFAQKPTIANAHVGCWQGIAKKNKEINEIIDRTLRTVRKGKIPWRL